MSEARIVKKILKALRKRGGFWVKLHGGPFQRDGLPDIIGSFHGKFVAFEVKQPGEEASKIQLQVLEEIKKKGKGLSAIVYSETDVLLLLSPVWGFDEREIHR